MTTEQPGFGQLVAAYLLLLQMPVGLNRAKADSLLAGLRDLIAELSETPAEVVQTHFEGRAAELELTRRAH